MRIAVRLTKTRRVLLGVVAIVAVLLGYSGWWLAGWITARGDDTWVFDSSHGWVERSTNPAPSIRTGAAMSDDPADGVVVLFGGSPPASPLSLDDTWTWNGTGWHREAAPTHPRGLSGAAIAYDTVGRRLVLFGGLPTLSPPNQQADFSPPPGCRTSVGANGQKVPPPPECLPPSGSAPSPGASPESAETWAYLGGSWQRLTTAHSPSAREGALAFDASAGRLILFGGTTQPKAEGGPANLLGDTWAFDGSDWAPLSTVGGPAARAYASFTSDAAGPLLFGGTAGAGLAGIGAGQALGDTWRWAGSSWHRLTPAHSPSARYSAGMASAGQRGGGLVLFGGQLGCGGNHAGAGCSTAPYLDDTWTWDGSDWRAMSNGFHSTHPRARAGASLAYLGKSRVFVLFGSQDPHLLALP